MSALSRSGRPGRKQSMRKQYEESETRRNRILFITALVIALTLIAAVAFDAVGTLFYWMASEAEADTITEEVWVLCKPEGTVNLRATPGGRVFGGCQSGAKMWTDNRTKNGFLHVLELAAEEDSGWISSRYIVFDEPREVMDGMVVCSQGRVACREWIGGKVIRWVQDGELVTVYWISDEWAVTEFGYIRSVYLGQV